MIIAALFVEKAIEDFVTTMIPGFNSVLNARDMTFSLKIELAKAL